MSMEAMREEVEERARYVFSETCSVLEKSDGAKRWIEIEYQIGEAQFGTYACPRRATLFEALESALSDLGERKAEVLQASDLAREDVERLREIHPKGIVLIDDILDEISKPSKKQRDDLTAWFNELIDRHNVGTAHAPYHDTDLAGGLIEGEQPETEPPKKD